MALSREQQQYIWDVMGDIYSRKLGAKVEFTLPPEKEQETAQAEQSSMASESGPERSMTEIVDEAIDGYRREQIGGCVISTGF